jgi:hypothetical protein
MLQRKGLKPIHLDDGIALMTSDAISGQVDVGGWFDFVR